MRCPLCGNENPETHRFCGMCGASLLQGPGAAMAAPGNSIAAPAAAPATAPAPRGATPAATATISRPSGPQASSPAIAPRATTAQPAAMSTATTAGPEPPHNVLRPPQRANEEEPIISGPSFLGLNQPAASPPKRGNLSIHPDAAPGSRSLDYLLEDEEPKSGGGWKVVLILIALALAVSFGYLRWKNQGLPFLNPTPKPPAQTPDNTQAPATPDANAAAPANATNAPAEAATPNNAAANGNSAASTPAPAPGTPGAQPTSNPAPPATAIPSAGGSTATNSAGTSSSSSTGPPVTAASPAESGPNPSSTQPAQSPKGNAPANAAPETQTSAPASSDHSNSASDANQPSSDNAAAATEQTRKPPAAIKRSDPVAEAQKYLYGKGATQDCDRGLRLLKPSANAGNPKAMIEMGALYSAGLCTPRDLPTAYRWFAMALRKDPDNQSVATDLQKLWGEMTQPERQLAIRLSQ